MTLTTFILLLLGLDLTALALVIRQRLQRPRLFGYNTGTRYHRF